MPELSRFEGMIIYMLFRDNEEEAYSAWNLAVSGEHFEKISPL